VSGIYGIVRFDGAPVDPEELAHMRRALAYYGPDGGGEWRDGPVGLGQLQLCATPEDRFEIQPLRKAGVTLVAAARLDNRDELLREFAIPTPDQPTTPDSTLVLEAWLRWGEKCPDRLDGDWQFAAWDERKRRLFIARDQHGNTGLCYYRGSRFLAFAPNLQGLLALAEVPRRPNLLRMAQVLTSWSGDGIETGYLELVRLPPAHTLSIDQATVATRRYWFPEQLPPLRFPDDNACLEEFLALYRRAVRVRLRSPRAVGISLSSGFDSGSVAALAAPLLAETGRKLIALTSVPAFALPDFGPYVAGDEWPLAAAAAAHIGNIDHRPVRAEHAGILSGIEKQLSMHSEPGHAPSNYYWLTDLMATARTLGIGTLLSGQGGNGTVSYDGLGTVVPHLLRSRWPTAARTLRLTEPSLWLGIKRQLLKPLLLPAIRRYRQFRSPEGPPWHTYAAIHPDFARSIALAERMRQDSHDPTFFQPTGRDGQLDILRPGASTIGALNHEGAAWYGLDERDPTLDRQVIEFCLRLPDLQYRRRGEERLLLRRAMAGLMPSEVLNNRRFGVQAADIGARVRRERAEIGATLESLERSELARTCLDLPRMGGVLAALEREVTAANSSDCVTILLRGLGVGLFLSTFDPPT